MASIAIVKRSISFAIASSMCSPRTCGQVAGEEVEPATEPAEPAVVK